MTIQFLFSGRNCDVGYYWPFMLQQMSLQYHFWLDWYASEIVS